jgi:hypothetical protein
MNPGRGRRSSRERWRLAELENQALDRWTSRPTREEVVSEVEVGGERTPSPDLVAAEVETAGRGRSGRRACADARSPHGRGSPTCNSIIVFLAKRSVVHLQV